MTTKIKVIVAVASLVSAFAGGRYLAPEKVKTEVKVVEVEKKTSQVDRDSQLNRHKETETTKITHPDGTIEERTKVTEDATRASETSKRDTTDRSTTESASKETVRGSSKVTISALGGVKLVGTEVVYGASIYKPVLGPITVGVWGLSNSTFGAALGLTF